MANDQRAESWVDIANFPGYQVSDSGKVRTRNHGRTRSKCPLAQDWKLLVPYQLPSGYLQVGLWHNGERRPRYIHRLVLEAFVGPCPQGCEARHVTNPDKSDNRLSNLEWGTRKQNGEDAARHGTVAHGSRSSNAKLNGSQVAAILQDVCSGATTVKKAAAAHGVRPESVSRIANGHHWKRFPGDRKIPEASVSGGLTTAALAKRLGVTQARVGQLIREGVLAATRCRHGWVVTEDELKRSGYQRQRKAPRKNLDTEHAAAIAAKLG